MSEVVSCIPHPLLLLFIMIIESLHVPTQKHKPRAILVYKWVRLELKQSSWRHKDPKSSTKPTSIQAFFSMMAVPIPPTSPLLICMQTHLLFKLSSSLKQKHGACKQEGSCVFDRNHPYNWNHSFYDKSANEQTCKTVSAITIYLK